MINISKPFYLKLFYAVIALTFISLPAIAEDKKSSTIFNKPGKSSTMRSASWRSPKPEETKASEEAIEEKDEDIATDENAAETELTADEALWKKYKDLAAGNGDDAEDLDGASEEKDDDIAETDTTKEYTDSKKEEASLGIRGIIEDYKKAQGGKGKMNSRTFGKLD